ncbi:MAG: hypothetical protein M3O20_01275 [Acidobacteriota bacterium]|nr:hypothetical protein [Acidobacteriota bacterium]
MDWQVIVVLNVIFAILAAFLWAAGSGPKKAKVHKRAIRHRHEEFEIDPAEVPHFKSTWRDVH